MVIKAIAFGVFKFTVYQAGMRTSRLKFDDKLTFSVEGCEQNGRQANCTPKEV